ncbi:MAG: hypothetical protein QM704_11245 [Anaeromyxobacteraceae bacterium]
MLFFGDASRSAEPRAVLASLRETLAALASLPAGPDRHSALAAALVGSGILAQALADAPGEAGAPESMALTASLARALWRSFRTGGRAAVPSGLPLAPLEAAPMPPRVRLRRPEGFALYGLAPEAHAVAARALSSRRDRLVVLGLRSIGTALAAMVAAGAGSDATPFTVRPTGHPWSREVTLPHGFPARGATVAIADEGPGLSGSSLAAAARAALEAGAAEVVLLPAHAGGPGPAASPETRALLASLSTRCVPSGRLVAGRGPLALPRLVEDLTGPADGPAACLAGGAWRTHVPGAARAPSTGWLERPKHLLSAGGRRWLARLAGHGEEGPRRLARARALAAAGLWGEPAGLRHGLILEPWLEGARPLPVAPPPARAALRAALARWVAVAAARPAPPEAGADPEAVARMISVNAAEALGPEAAAGAARLAALAPEVARQARAVELDGRPAAWKWHVLADGRLAKADGADHLAGHELAGCQDALWDVAGAALELGLEPAEERALAEAARAAGPGADPSLLPFYRAAHAAQELGRWTFAASSAVGPDRARCEGERDRYRAALAAALG